MRKKIYDWDAWFASGRFVLRRGRDYTCSQGTMAQQVRNAAAKRGISVSLVESDGSFVVTVVGEKTHA